MYPLNGVLDNIIPGNQKEIDPDIKEKKKEVWSKISQFDEQYDFDKEIKTDICRYFNSVNKLDFLIDNIGDICFQVADLLADNVKPHLTCKLINQYGLVELERVLIGTRRQLERGQINTDDYDSIYPVLVGKLKKRVNNDVEQNYDRINHMHDKLFRVIYKKYKICPSFDPDRATNLIEFLLYKANKVNTEGLNRFFDLVDGLFRKQDFLEMLNEFRKSPLPRHRKLDNTESIALLISYFQ